MEKIKIFALGGLDENGKNMYCVEVDDKIIIIDCGIKYPDFSSYGVECIIPDFNYLIENKERIVAIFITHAHDDVMGGLPYLLKNIDAPVYTGALTASILKDTLRKEGVKKYQINKVKRSSRLKIAGIEVRTFAMTHAFPDNFGVAIGTAQGYVVYNGEFIVDYDILSPQFNFDIVELAQIGKKGVLCLLSESQYADKKGASAPNHRITDVVNTQFANAEGRIIISSYSQSLFRIIEIIELAIKYKKRIYFYDAELRRLIKKLEELKYYHIEPEYLVEDKQFNNNDEDVVVIVSGNARDLFKYMYNIVTLADRKVQYRPTDTLIVASPVVVGSESDAINMENEVYKSGGKVFALRSKQVLSMHPSIEDLKMMLNLFKPKYYMPIKGEYRHLIANAKVATNVGYDSEHIVILDNGQIASFEAGERTHDYQMLKLEEVLIDGNEDLDVRGPVMKDREILATDGVIIFGVTLDFKTKKVIGGPDIQSRGVIYLKDQENLINQMNTTALDIINKNVEANTYENMATRNEIREKLSKFLNKEIGKRPMLLPVILEINSKDKD